jgi:hypothetical protein
MRLLDTLDTWPYLGLLCAQAHARTPIQADKGVSVQSVQKPLLYL